MPRGRELLLAAQQLVGLDYGAAGGVGGQQPSPLLMGSAAGGGGGQHHSPMHRGLQQPSPLLMGYAAGGGGGQHLSPMHRGVQLPSPVLMGQQQPSPTYRGQQLPSHLLMAATAGEEGVPWELPSSHGWAQQLQQLWGGASMPGWAQQLQQLWGGSQHAWMGSAAVGGSQQAWMMGPSGSSSQPWGNVGGAVLLKQQAVRSALSAGDVSMVDQIQCRMKGTPVELQLACPFPSLSKLGTMARVSTAYVVVPGPHHNTISPMLQVYTLWETGLGGEAPIPIKLLELGGSRWRSKFAPRFFEINRLHNAILAVQQLFHYRDPLDAVRWFTEREKPPLDSLPKVNLSPTTKA